MTEIVTLIVVAGLIGWNIFLTIKLNLLRLDIEMVKANRKSDKVLDKALRELAGIKIDLLCRMIELKQDKRKPSNGRVQKVQETRKA